MSLILDALLCVAFVQDLEPPIRLQAADAPIDGDIGHAAPFVYDFDRDGVRDLLVGQFGGGQLRLYRNLGTNLRPRFGEVDWFRVDGEIVTTPAG